MYEMSRQEKIDRMMCKPGYTWNETLQKCLGAYGPPKENPEQPAPPEPEPQPLPTPEEAIQHEIASRETTGEVA